MFTSFKHLGFTNFPMTVSSCMARLGQINRVKHAFDTTTLTIMTNALVFSKLYYCCNVWSNTSEHNLNRIQGVQNFAARNVSGSKKYDHISPILKDLRWLPVRQQLYFRHAIMAFKCMTGCAPDSLFSKYVQRTTITKRTTRNSQMLNIPLYKTATGQRTFYYRTVKLWNSLDHNLKLNTSGLQTLPEDVFNFKFFRDLIVSYEKPFWDE